MLRTGVKKIEWDFIQNAYSSFSRTYYQKILQPIPFLSVKILTRQTPFHSATKSFIRLHNFFATSADKNEASSKSNFHPRSFRRKSSTGTRGRFVTLEWDSTKSSFFHEENFHCNKRNWGKYGFLIRSHNLVASFEIFSTNVTFR